MNLYHPLKKTADLFICWMKATKSQLWWKNIFVGNEIYTDYEYVLDPLLLYVLHLSHIKLANANIEK